MSFKIDYSKAAEFEGVQNGTYEVIVKTAHETVSKSGKEHIYIDFVIRNDIEQDFKNFHIFYKFWKQKEDGKYNLRRFTKLVKDLRVPDGKEYENLQACLDDFVGKVCKVRVANEKSTSKENGQTYDNLNVKQTDVSAYPSIQHKWKVDDQPETPVNVDEYDLPF